MIEQVLRVVGFLLILGAVAVGVHAALASRVDLRRGSAKVALLLGLGVVLTQLERVSEFGAFRFREQAKTELEDIKRIRQGVEAAAKDAKQALERAEEAASATESIQGDMADQVEVGFIAKLDFFGMNDLGGMSTSTGYSWRNDENGDLRYSVDLTEKGLTWKCDPESIALYREQIETRPDFPFPYWLLSACLKKDSVGDWRTPAEKAREILSKTVKVPGHHQHHDAALAEIERMLAAQ